MIVGFTGSQHGMTNFQREELSKLLILNECSEFHHGDCIGSDEQANMIAVVAGITIFCIHPPDNPNKRAFCFDKDKLTHHLAIPIDKYAEGIHVKWYPTMGYLERNKKIVDSVSIMIAAPKEYRNTVRSGTWSTIRYAWKTKKKNLIIIPPVERPTDIEEVNAE